MTRDLLKRYREFRAIGVGSVVGQQAKTCLDLARSVVLAEEIGLTVSWADEEGDWMDFAGDPVEEYRRKFENGDWYVMHAWVEGDGGETLASLGGIVLAHDRASKTYRLIVEAELLAEALGAIRRGEAA